jgi:hypothetical protein
MAYFYIYKMTHPQTGEFYIGRRKSEVLPSMDSYRGSSSTWYSMLSKEVINSILIKEIIEDSYKSMDELSEAESFYIKQNINNPLCKNAYVPGKGFYCKSVNEETRKKISKSLKSYIPTEEHRLNNSNAQIGKILKEEHKNKISNSMKSIMSEERINQISENQKGKEPWNKGSSLSESHKQNISKSKKEGMSDEIREKISNAGKGRIPWNKGKKTVRRTKKQIEELKAQYQNENGETMELNTEVLSDVNDINVTDVNVVTPEVSDEN